MKDLKLFSAYSSALLFLISENISLGLNNSGDTADEDPTGTGTVPH
jgi:hypothetical protein